MNPIQTSNINQSMHSNHYTIYASQAKKKKRTDTIQTSHINQYGHHLTEHSCRLEHIFFQTVGKHELVGSEVPCNFHCMMTGTYLGLEEGDTLTSYMQAMLWYCIVITDNMIHFLSILVQVF